MSSEDDMIDEMGITHDGTKVRRMLQLHKTFQAMGSPPATIILYRNTRGDDDSLATLSRQHHHGLFRWPPYGSLPHSSRAIQMAALWASSSLFTGYSDGSPLGVFLTLRGLFRWPPFRPLLRFSLLTEKNAAGAWCLGGRFYWIEWGITLGRCPTIRGWSKHHLECSKSLCCPRCLSCGRREPFRQWPASSHCCTCTHVSTGASGDTACPRG